MKTRTIALFSTLLLASSSLLFAQNADRERPQRGQGGNRERPDPFALADKDESGGVTLEELVNSRIELMSRRGGQSGPPRGEGNARRGGGQERPRGGQGGGRDPAAMKKQLTERMAEAFKKADKDESGELSRQEFGQMAQGPRGGGGQRGGGQRGQGGPRGGGDA